MAAIGITATVTGIYVVLAGVDGQTDGGAATSSVESELRFFAVFWIAYGVAALWVAPRAERETLTVRALALILFGGGIARGVAWIDEGRPHALFVVLMCLELLIPCILLILQRRIGDRVR